MAKIIFFFSKKNIMLMNGNSNQFFWNCYMCFVLFYILLLIYGRASCIKHTRSHTHTVGWRQSENTSHSEHMKSLAMLKLLMSVPNTRVNTRDLLCSMPCSAFVCLQIEYDMYFSIWSYISNSSFFSFHRHHLFIQTNYLFGVECAHSIARTN